MAEPTAASKAASTAAQRFSRTGAAARKPVPATPRTPRRGRAAAPAEAAAGVAGGEVPSSAVADEVAVRLALALAELPEDLRGNVAGYRSTLLPDEQWAEVADLVRLGVAVHGPRNAVEAKDIGWALTVHARVHLVLGTSRTIAGWYGPDAVNTSLAGGRFGTGASAYTPPQHFGSSYNARVRAIGRTLVPSTPPPPRKFSGYDPQAPLSTAELDEVFDFCDAHRNRRIGERMARLVRLTAGTGAKNADLGGILGTAVQTTAHAVVLTTAGDAPRRIPVLAGWETGVLDDALAAGDGPLFDGIDRTYITDTIVYRAGWKATERFSLTNGRLRQTWLATVLAAGAPYPGILRAAGISGDRNLAALVARLPALDDAAYEAALRCGTGPLPVRGQLTLPGWTHPTPHVPLAEPAGDRP